MTASKVKPLTFRDEVMTWGNRDPWKKMKIRLKHQVTFTDSDVTRDGQGNIIDMPLLHDKSCFGRPEAFFRHGKRTQKQRTRHGRVVDGKNHQCGRCPSGVWDSCGRTAWERVNSDPAIRKAFDEWQAVCAASYNGALICTGSASRPWGRFKEAIVARGPFYNSNDGALQKLEDENRKKERDKWARNQRRRRRKQRADARDARKLPSRQFVQNVRDERDLRKQILMSVLGQPGQPRSRRQVLADDVVKTATIMANAWAVGEIMREAAVVPKPGSIARVMTNHGLGAGLERATLNARIRNDLKRSDECGADGTWTAFDPDLDLEDYGGGDDEAVDDKAENIRDLTEAWMELATPARTGCSKTPYS